MKKLLPMLLLITALSTAVTACGGAAQPEAPATPQAPAASAQSEPADAPQPSKTISFMTVGDPYVGAITELLPAFEQATGIQVVMDSVPYTNMHEKAIIELVGNSGSYDLISVDAPWIGEFVEGGHVLDITDLVERDKAELNQEDFLQGAWEGLAMWNGRVVALPLAPYYMYMHYRTDVFAEKNITPPVTYDDFMSAVQTLYDAGQPFYGASVAMKRGPSIVHDWCAYFNGFGGKTFEDVGTNYKSAINSEIGIKTAELFKAMVQYSPPGVLQYENIDRWNDFMHGNSGMVAVFNANSPMFETAEDSTVAGKVGYAPFPKMSASDKDSMPFGGFALSINADSKNVEEAWQFMKWLTSAETDKKWVQVPGTPGVPLRMSTVKDADLVRAYPYFKLISDAEENGTADGVEYRARVPEWVRIEEILGLELNLAVSGEKDVKQALDDAAAQMDALMKERGYPVF